MDRYLIEARYRIAVISANLHLVLELAQRSNDSHISVHSTHKKIWQIVRKLLTVVLDVEGRLDRSCAVVDREGLPLRRALLYIADDSADRYLDSQFHVKHTVDIEVSKY